MRSDPAAAARLAAFFTHFGDRRRAGPVADLPTRLAKLFARLRPLLAETPGGSVTTPVALGSAGTIVDEARLRQLFERLAGPLEQARRDGSLADVWAIAGLGRNELRNAAALAALWNPHLCGATAVAFLAGFVARLGPDENLPTRAELDAGYIVRTEDRPEGEASERVDITIEGQGFLLGIELKIDAGEGLDQLARYQSALQVRASHRRLRSALVYLSPRMPSDPHIHHARWGDVAAAARSVVPRDAAERRFIHSLVGQFATHVASFRGDHP